MYISCLDNKAMKVTPPPAMGCIHFGDVLDLPEGHSLNFLVMLPYGYAK